MVGAFIGQKETVSFEMLKFEVPFVIEASLSSRCIHRVTGNVLEEPNKTALPTVTVC